MRRRLLLLVTIFSSLSCSQPSVRRADTHHFMMISMQGEFEKFWAAAKDKTFSEQLKVWHSMVEVPESDFFETFTGPKRALILKTDFDYYRDNSRRVIETFASFERVMLSKMTRLSIEFPDADFRFPVFAAVGGSFIARMEILKTFNKKALAIEIDRMAADNLNPEVLYTHELFHIYHTQVSGIVRGEPAYENYPMTIPLWTEGLATWVSHELVPRASVSELLASEALAKFPEEKISELAAAFLQVAYLPGFDKKNPELYRNWFELNEAFGPGQPGRAGVLLGYKVAERLRAQFSLAQMAKWKAQEADEHVLKTLHTMVDEARVLDPLTRRMTRLYDFSPLLEPKTTFLGFIGTDYQRLHIEFSAVSKSDSNPLVYVVRGSSAFKDQTCKFSGKIEVTQIVQFKKMHFGADDIMKAEKLQAEGALEGTYNFEEDPSLPECGVLTGHVKLFWYLDRYQKLHYDDIENYSDRYRNNQYEGLWSPRQGKPQTANFGEYRIPNSGELDGGAGEFVPRPKYYKNGWEGFEH